MRLITLVSVVFLVVTATSALADSIQQIPRGWEAFGSQKNNYSVKKDPNDNSVLDIQHVGDNISSGQDISVKQVISSQNFINNRVEFSAELSTENAGKAGIWIRVNDAKNEIISLSTLGNASINGSTGWQRYSVVIDVPPNSTTLAYGVALHGDGSMQVKSLSLAPVGKDIPLTPTLPITPPAELPRAPVNLSLDQ